MLNTKLIKKIGCVIAFLCVQISFADTFKVAIDVGHTMQRPGATSARGVSEYFFNKRLATEVLKKLTDQRVNAFIVSDDKPLTLKRRALIAAKENATLFISIHADSVNKKYLKEWEYDDETHHYSDKFKGYSIFIGKKHKQSSVFAVILGQALRDANLHPTYHHAEKIKGENRKILDRELGIYDFGKLVVLRKAQMPALLFEMGVIVNREEELKLTSDIYLEALADIITNSIITYSAYNKRNKEH